MRILLLVLGLALIGCKNDMKETSSVIIVDNTKAQAFEGNFGCKNGSFIELLQDSNGNITFETIGQSLNSVNPNNNTIGTHPTISDRNIAVINSSVRVSRNYTYSSSTHDLEQDTNGSNITGSHRTDVRLQLIKGGIKVSIDIWAGAVNSNINNIVAKRVFECY